MPEANGQAYQLGAMQHIKLLFFKNIKQYVRVIYLNVSNTGTEKTVTKVRISDCSKLHRK